MSISKLDCSLDIVIQSIRTANTVTSSIVVFNIFNILYSDLRGTIDDPGVGQAAPASMHLVLDMLFSPFMLHW
jgi:hypothetical protein